MVTKSRDSSVGIATSYRLDDLDSIPVRFYCGNQQFVSAAHMGRTSFFFLDGGEG
jgi:hypothetical protein